LVVTDLDNCRTAMGLLTAASNADDDLMMFELMAIPVLQTFGVLRAMTTLAAEMLDMSCDFEDDRRQQMLHRIAMRFQMEDV
jgi:hypothetical protein